MRIRLLACFTLILLNASGAEFHLSPTGDDAGPGTRERPFATLSRAQRAVRPLAGRESVTVWLHAGTYYLPETLVFTAADSGTAHAPVTWRARPGETAVLSGGVKLRLQWEPYRDGIQKAAVPPGLAIDQLFVNGRRQPLARYPDYDPTIRIYGGYAADAFSRERAARWANPAGGFLHAMHSAEWGDYHYRIRGKKADGSLDYEGGWQNNRQMGMHAERRFVENIFEELDAPAEWFLRDSEATLYYRPPAGLDLTTAVVEAVRLRHLLEFRGSPEQPVHDLAFRDLTFRHAARTFMDNREPLLRSDWTTYRGGAILFAGATDCALDDCFVDQVGGNAVFVTGFNRRLAFRGLHIAEAGANGVAFVGDPKAVRNPLLEYHQRQGYAAIDPTPGPQSPDYPADCLVEDCLIYRSGRVEKQTAPVQIAMARRITVRHCSLYDVPRAGINIGDGCWGGHVIEHCDVFDTVKETGDHGSFNSWGRDRYWGLEQAPANALPALALLDTVDPIVLRHNRWRCDHGWDIDLDDGSSHYEIQDNLLLNGGLKLREGFHRRVWNNITVNNTFHPHVWYEQSGDVVTNNIWMGAYRPAAMDDRLQRWGREVDRNFFTTSEADRLRYAGKGCDVHSLAGDPRFVDPARGDYRVQDGSPALALGFRNFAMQGFGVRTPALRSLARSADFPPSQAIPRQASAPSDAPANRQPVLWLQAQVRNLQGEEHSVFGVPKDSGGVVIVSAAPESAAARAGFQAGDLVQSVHGTPIRQAPDLLRLTESRAGQERVIGFVRGQKRLTLTVTLPAASASRKPLAP